MIDAQSQEAILIESGPHIDNYYSDEPWDILMEDSVKMKSMTFSTNTISHGEEQHMTSCSSNTDGQIHHGLGQERVKNQIYRNEFSAFVYCL